MKKNKLLLLILIALMRSIASNGQNLFLQENAAVFVKEGADLQVGGDLDNNGLIENLGKISLFGDFFNNSILNSTMGELSFQGDAMQRLVSPSLEISNLVIDGFSNELMLESNIIRILSSVEFVSGIIKKEESAQFIIEAEAEVLGGNESSYFDGELIQIGTGFKYYPIGNNGLFAPITMEDIRGINVRMKVSASVPNSLIPLPAENVIGVSEHAVWKLDLVEGTVDSILLSMDFAEADLNSFTNENEINANLISPVLLQKGIEDEFFQTLGVSELLDTDSVTFGRITAEEYLKLSIDDGKYVALGLAPILPNEGAFYIPNAFSPNAFDEDNKSFRVFGEKVVNEDFELKIFNRSNVIVYETNDFIEANTVGWDGINKNNGNDEPSGLYYYTISYKLEDGVIRREQNAIYLIR